MLTLSWKLADLLRSFKDLGGLEHVIQQATQQLAMLNSLVDGMGVGQGNGNGNRDKL